MFVTGGLILNSRYFVIVGNTVSLTNKLWKQVFIICC